MNHSDIPARPSLAHGIVAAAALAVAGAAIFAGLSLWVTPYVALRWVATLLAASYGAYLLANTNRKRAASSPSSAGVRPRLRSPPSSTRWRCS